MWITIKSGIIDSDTYQENELLGKEHYEDDQVDVVEHRIMVSHIIDFWPQYKNHKHTEIALTDYRVITALESPESVERKLKKALITPTNN